MEVDGAFSKSDGEAVAVQLGPVQGEGFTCTFQVGRQVFVAAFDGSCGTFSQGVAELGRDLLEDPASGASRSSYSKGVVTVLLLVGLLVCLEDSPVTRSVAGGVGTPARVCPKTWKAR